MYVCLVFHPVAVNVCRVGLSPSRPNLSRTRFLFIGADLSRANGIMMIPFTPKAEAGYLLHDTK